jgi:hypothetical protein
MQSPLGDVTLRFMLIEASSTATQKDPAIAALERELTSLLKFNGYTLVSQAVISMGVAREVGGFTPRSAASSQYLSGPGGVYELRLTSTSGIQGSGDNASVNMNVDLRYAGGYPSQGLGGINQLLGAQGYGGRAGTAPPSSIASADSPPQPPGRGGRGGRAGTPQGGRAGGAPTPALAMYSRVLSTTVRLVNGRTLILGTTQPAGPGEALILAVIPIIRL